MSLRIIRKTYRGEEGFLIVGTNTRGHHISIFTKTRESAERIRAKQNAGQDTTLEDFS